MEDVAAGKSAFVVTVVVTVMSACIVPTVTTIMLSLLMLFCMCGLPNSVRYLVGHAIMGRTVEINR